MEGAAWRKKLKCEFCGTEVLVKPKDPGRDFVNRDQIGLSPARLRLYRLDRAWRRRRDSLMVEDSRGRSHIPTREDAIVVVVLALVFGAVAFALLRSALFGLAILVIAGVLGYRFYQMAEDYEQARRRFRKRRRQVLDAVRNESPNPD